MMDETTPAEKPRKTRSDKGKPHGQRPVRMLPAPEAPAPIDVVITLKNGVSTQFGCARRTVENGFHVFFYPSERDRYRETRREFAISEIMMIEITEARQYEFTVQRPAEVPTEMIVPPQPSRGPVVHRAPRGGGRSVIEQLENSTGPIKMDEVPNLTFGGSAG